MGRGRGGVERAGRRPAVPVGPYREAVAGPRVVEAREDRALVRGAVRAGPLGEDAAAQVPAAAVSGSICSGDRSSSRTTVAVTRWREACCSWTERCSESWTVPATAVPITGAAHRMSSSAARATQASIRSVVRRSGLCRQRQSPVMARTDHTPFPLRAVPRGAARARSAGGGPAAPVTGPDRPPTPRRRLSRTSHTRRTRGREPGSRTRTWPAGGSSGDGDRVAGPDGAGPSGTRFCPKTSLPSRRRCRPRVASGSRPRRPSPGRWWSPRSARTAWRPGRPPRRP